MCLRRSRRLTNYSYWNWIVSGIYHDRSRASQAQISIILKARQAVISDWLIIKPCHRPQKRYETSITMASHLHQSDLPIVNVKYSLDQVWTKTQTPSIVFLVGW